MNATNESQPGPSGQELPLIPKELSWVAFNERVLQEAENPDVPLIERIRYLGICSSNMDEFYRVRVADLRRLVTFSSGKQKEKHELLYAELQKIIHQSQQRFERIFHENINALRQHDIHLIDESEVASHQVPFILQYFHWEVMPLLRPVLFADTGTRMPSLTDGSIYFAIKLVLENDQVRYSLLEIPTPPLPRFVVIPQKGKSREKVLILMENIIRYCLKDVFRGTLPIKEAKGYTFKLTRDAEIELGENISQSILDKMTSSLKKRKHGDPVRFIYDKEMPEDLLSFLVRQLNFGKYDSLLSGGRYHNVKDFIKFPNLGGPALEHKRNHPIPLPALEKAHLVFDAIRQQDILLHFPYHSFHYIENFLYTAALDPSVRSIKITLYRLASDSHIANALINAVHNRKKVTVVLELQARFDEQANIQWANQLTDAGVQVIFGIPGLKVHSKLILVERMEAGHVRYYTHIGTGNFNERTARVYTDLSLLTSHQDIGQEVANIFEFIQHTYRGFKFRHLLVSPFGFRTGLTQLIEQEIAHAKVGKTAAITLKCNNLVDTAIIEKLYEASNAGVKIRLIVRGMMSLVAGQKGFSENIEAISIVDRYLEHSRVYIFENGGEPLYYIGSGDIMTRNLDHRVEVICPIYDQRLKLFLQQLIETQWSDRCKARILDKNLSNGIKAAGEKEKMIRSQFDTFKVVEKFSRQFPA